MSTNNIFRENAVGVFGLFPFIIGGRIVYSDLLNLYPLSGVNETISNFNLYNFAGFALLTLGLWMIFNKKLKVISSKRFIGLFLGVLSFGYGMSLLLVPIYPFIKGLEPSAVQNWGIQIGGWENLTCELGLILVGIGLLLLIDKETVTKQNPSQNAPVSS
jgi:hypothetical protein